MINNQKSRLWHYIFIIFATVTITLLCAGTITAAALDYDSLSDEVLEHIKVRSRVDDLIRAAGFTILKFIAKLVDEFDEAIDTIMHLNLYDLLDDNFKWDMQPLAWSIFSLFVIIAGVLLMIYADKLKISDTIRNIIISATVIIAMPTFISALQDLRDKGVDAVDKLPSNVNVVDEEGLVYGLGDQILSQNLIVLSPSEDDGKLHYYDEVSDRRPGHVYRQQINGVLSNEVWDKKPGGIESIDSVQIKFSELTTLNMMELLGLRGDYIVFTQAKNDDLNVTVSNQYDENGNIREPDGQISGQPYWDTALYTADEYQKYIINNEIANHDKVYSYGLSDAVRSKNTIEEALEVIRDTVIRDLNIKRNEYVLANNSSIFYAFEDLDTEADYAEMSWSERIIQNISTLGYPVEYVYAYDMNFCYTFFILLITAICLLFAGLKLGTLLYDLLFMTIIGPIAAATDATGSGRAKKVVMELISTFVIFIVVALDLKIYLISISGIFNHIDNTIAIIMLLLSGAKFVIDGPDIVVKLMGIDAGVKSGASTFMAINTAANVAFNAARTVGGAARTATAVAKNTGGFIKSVPNAIAGAEMKMANFAGQTKAAAQDIKNGQGFVEKFSKVFGNTAVGQAYRQGAAERSKNNNSYYSEMGLSPETTSSDSTIINSNVSAGKDGRDGKDGKDGLNGINGADGKDGTNAQDNNTMPTDNPNSSNANDPHSTGNAFSETSNVVSENSNIKDAQTSINETADTSNQGTSSDMSVSTPQTDNTQGRAFNETTPIVSSYGADISNSPAAQDEATAYQGNGMTFAQMARDEESSKKTYAEIEKKKENE